MKVQGTIKLIGEDQKITDRFTKREFVIETDEKYPQTIMIELHQDRVDIIDPYKVGQKVEVTIDLRGRKWTSPQGEDKYFNTIVGWRIKSLESAPKTTPEHQKPEVDLDGKEEDDLPF